METFWTIQHIEKWKEFESTGALRATPDIAEPLFASSYQWMTQQMQGKIGPPGSPEITMPIWAWYRYDINRRKPDLRRSAHLQKKTKGVRIEFQTSFNKIILSDFIMWHLVLNSEKETRTWQDIFINPSQSIRLRKNIVQATLWEIDISQVKDVTFFTAR